MKVGKIFRSPKCVRIETEDALTRERTFSSFPHECPSKAALYFAKFFGEHFYTPYHAATIPVICSMLSDFIFHEIH